MVAQTGYRVMLREMAAEERLREKRGSAGLSDGEHLAINLNADTAGETFSDSRIVGRF